MNITKLSKRGDLDYLVNIPNNSGCRVFHPTVVYQRGNRGRVVLECSMLFYQHAQLHAGAIPYITLLSVAEIHYYIRR